MISDAKQIKNKITQWRRDLHTIPEVGLSLPQTKQYITKVLAEMGVAPSCYKNHSGISVVFGQDTGKTIAIRADMDALPLKEELSVPYKSTNNNMHACGHDAHAAILLGVAELLSKKYAEKLNGQIKLIFQPGEEGPGGALPMIESNVLENPKVDAILALHVGNIIGEGEVGDLFVGRGPVFAWDDQLRITINAKGGHAAKPYECKDPILAACQIVSHLQTIISREIEPWDPVVLSVTNIKSATDTFNIIPDSIIIKGTIRTTNINTRNKIFNRIIEIARHISRANNVKERVEFIDGYPAVVNDNRISEIVRISAERLIGKNKVKNIDSPNMGGEDAGFFFQKIPGCYFFLNNSIPVNGVIYPHHNSKFSIDDSVLYIGTSVLLDSAIEYLNTDN